MQNWIGGVKERILGYGQLVRAALSQSRDSIARLGEADYLVYYTAGIGALKTDDGSAYYPLIDSVCDDLRSRGCSVVKIAYPRVVAEAAQSAEGCLTFDYQWLGYLVWRRLYRSLGRVLRIREPKSPYYGHMKKSKPIAVFCIGAPEIQCSEARQLSVPVVELLHGIGLTPFDGWTWPDLPREFLPACVLSYDQVSTTTLESCNQSSKKFETFEIQHPFLRLYADSLKRCALPKVFTQMPVLPTKGRKVVIYGICWGFAGDHPQRLSELDGLLPNGLFPPSIAMAVQATKATHFWCFRFHPVHFLEKEGRYKPLFKYMDDFCARNENAEWRVSSESSLYPLFEVADAHITMFSMMCYEAAMLGVPSLMLLPTSLKGWRDYLDELRLEGYMQRVEGSEDEVLQWLRAAKKLPPRPLSAVDETAWEHALSWLRDHSARAAPL